MCNNPVLQYYALAGEREWRRLTSAEGMVQFHITTHLLATYLPADAQILDLGGGPRRYAIWLAQRGHHVVLAEPAGELLSIARQKVAEAGVEAWVECVQSDARDLSRWPDGTFDAIVCLGPFYHLLTDADRARAASEVQRVLRPHGIAVVALMPPYSFLRRTLALPHERHHFRDASFVDRILEQGVFLNDLPGRFTHAYGMDPGAVEPFFARFGFELLTLVAAEGIAVGLEAALVELAEVDPIAYRAAFEVVLRTAADPRIVGLSKQMVYVGRKDT